ncbi:hypothetical protein Q7P37_007652 [Cladosporium fusiforme]
MENFFRDLLGLGINFKTQSRVQNPRESDPTSVNFGALPEHGITTAELREAFQNIANSKTNWGSPNFMGFPDAGNGIAALGAAVVIPFLNQNLANQSICSPKATFIEMEVVHWLRQQLGFQVPDRYTRSNQIGGILTLGGCLSNTVALMAAREFVFPGSSMTELGASPANIRVLVPDVIEHYSIRAAMSWLGMGEKHVVRVPVDSEYRVKLADLDLIIDQERWKPKVLWLDREFRWSFISHEAKMPSFYRYVRHHQCRSLIRTSLCRRCAIGFHTQLRCITFYDVQAMYRGRSFHVPHETIGQVAALSYAT